MTLSIRAVSTGDEDAVWGILRPAFRSGDTYTVDPEISRKDALTYWFGASHGAFVAHDGSKILGTYFLKRNQAGGGGHVCNCGYVTGHNAQGRGVARAMLEHSLSTAKNAGFLAMQYNFVVASNVRAVSTWEKAGFEIVGQLPKAFKHPELGFVDAFVMYKEL